MRCAGYELADGPESDGYTTIYILFGFWYGLRLLIGAGWFAAHKLGWVSGHCEARGCGWLGEV